jgi:hypothetical protein
MGSKWPLKRLGKEIYISREKKKKGRARNTNPSY